MGSGNSVGKGNGGCRLVVGTAFSGDVVVVVLVVVVVVVSLLEVDELVACPGRPAAGVTVLEMLKIGGNGNGTAAVVGN